MTTQRKAVTGVKALEALKPEAHDYTVRIAGHSGLVVRVLPSGTKVFNYIYELEGKRRRVTLGTFGAPPLMTLVEAQQAYATARAKVKDPLAPVDVAEARRDAKTQHRKTIIADREALTVEQLGTEYIEHYAKPRKRSWAEDKRILDKYIVPSWKERKARTIKRSDVTALMADVRQKAAERARRPGAGGVQANRVHSVVRQMFNYGIECELVESNPAKELKKARVREHSRDRTLTPEEVKTVFAKLDATNLSHEVKTIIRLMALTGQRQGEFRSMRLAHVNLETGVWTQPSSLTKNGKPHSIVLPRQAKTILAKQAELATDAARNAKTGAVKGTSPLMFPALDREGNAIEGKSIGKYTVDHAVKRWLASESDGVRRLDMPPWTPHDLRRTVATQIAAAGVSRTVIDVLQNHADASMGGRYDRHSYATEVANALQKWADKIEPPKKIEPPEPASGESSNVLQFQKGAA